MKQLLNVQNNHITFSQIPRGVFGKLAQISENVLGAGRTAQQAENGESDENLFYNNSVGVI
jgi:hypothetical protein